MGSSVERRKVSVKESRDGIRNSSKGQRKGCGDSQRNETELALMMQQEGGGRKALTVNCSRTTATENDESPVHSRPGSLSGRHVYHAKATPVTGEPRWKQSFSNQSASQENVLN